MGQRAKMSDRAERDEKTFPYFLSAWPALAEREARAILAETEPAGIDEFKAGPQAFRYSPRVIPGLALATALAAFVEG